MGNWMIRLIARVLSALHITVKVNNPLLRMARRKGRLEDALIEVPRATRHFSPPGLPIANTVDAESAPVGLDTVFMKDSPDYPEIEVPGVGILAQQGIGKTFLSLLLLLVWAYNDVGTDDQDVVNRPSRGRLAVDSFKVDKFGRPETAMIVTDIFGCEVIDPTRVPCNYFARAFGFTAAEHLELTTDHIEFWRGYSNKPPMSLAEHKVLQQLIDKMYGMEKRSFKVLAQLAQEYLPPAARLTEEELKTAAETDITVRFSDELDKAAFSLYLSLSHFVEGRLGRIFSGDDDELFARLIEQRIVSIHYRPLNDQERSHLELTMSLIQRTATEVLDPEDPKKRRRRFPKRLQHYVVQDEVYGSWANLLFAKRQYLKKKTQREFGTVLVEIFHQFTDMMEAIGSADSEQARLARNSLNEIGIWLVGRQKKSQFPILKQILGLSDEVLRTLPRLPKGHFYLILPGHAPHRIWVKGTKLAIERFNTEGATSELLRRYFEEDDPQYYKEYLVETSPEVEEDTPEEMEAALHVMA